MAIEQIDAIAAPPDPGMDADETGAALDSLVTSGKVKAVGVSNFRPWDMELLQSRMNNRLVTNQIEISLVENSAMTNGDLAYLQKHRIAPMAWSPLAEDPCLMGPTPAWPRNCRRWPNNFLWSPHHWLLPGCCTTRLLFCRLWAVIIFSGLRFFRGAGG